MWKTILVTWNRDWKKSLNKIKFWRRHWRHWKVSGWKEGGKWEVVETGLGISFCDGSMFCHLFLCPLSSIAFSSRKSVSPLLLSQYSMYFLPLVSDGLSQKINLDLLTRSKREFPNVRPSIIWECQKMMLEKNGRVRIDIIPVENRRLEEGSQRCLWEF